MDIQIYLSLFPGSTREKARFMSLAGAVLQQVMDLQAVVGELNSAFSPASAQGVQLDALGESLGLSRLDTSAGAAERNASAPTRVTERQREQIE